MDNFGFKSPPQDPFYDERDPKFSSGFGYILVPINCILSRVHYASFAGTVTFGVTTGALEALQNENGASVNSVAILVINLLIGTHVETRAILVDQRGG